jgi:flagellar hook-length control protein FliK
VTTLLPVAEPPGVTGTASPCELEPPSAEERAAFGALVDEAKASIEPRAEGGTTTDEQADADRDPDGGADGNLPIDPAGAIVPPPLVTLPLTTASGDRDTASGERASLAAAEVGAAPGPSDEITAVHAPAPGRETVTPDDVPSATPARPLMAAPHGRGAVGTVDQTRPPPSATTGEPARLVGEAVPLVAAAGAEAAREPVAASLPSTHDRAGEPAAVTVDLDTPVVISSAPAAAPVTIGATDAAAVPVAKAAPQPAGSEPWQQIAHVVRSVERDVDGTHRMTVRLDPPALGTVELEVRVHEGRLSVHATVDTAPTRDVLARALPDLRHVLESNGLPTGALDVGARSGGHGASGDRRDGAQGQRLRVPGLDARASGTVGPPQDPATATASARLDLRL